MSITKKIEYYSENIDNPDIQNEANIFAKKIKLIGNILYITGIILTSLSFIALIVLTIIYITKKELSLFQIIPFITMVIFSLLIVLGLYYKRLSLILLDE